MRLVKLKDGGAIFAPINTALAIARAYSQGEFGLSGTAKLPSGCQGGSGGPNPQLATTQQKGLDWWAESEWLVIVLTLERCEELARELGVTPEYLAALGRGRIRCRAWSAGVVS